MIRTLVADIGGTNSRFVVAGDCPSHPKQIATFKNDAFSHFDAVMLRAISEVGIVPDRVVIAVAGPVGGGRASLTNRNWTLEEKALSELVGRRPVRLINDFQALAQSLPFLEREGLQTIANEGPEQEGHKLVVGAGTGLGVGYLIRAHDMWSAAAGEGGHVALPVQTPREFELMQHVGRGLERVSAERILSGPGLVALCNSVRILNGRTDLVEHPSEVVQAARLKDDSGLEAARVFVRLLGRVTGDFALALIPKGGIYLGGGVTPKLLDCVGPAVFVEELQSKGRVSSAIDKFLSTLFVNRSLASLGPQPMQIQ